jgi:hypothetical protein
MTRIRGLLGLAFALAVGVACAHAPTASPTGAPIAGTSSGDIPRADWVAVPARGGGREVITRTRYLEERARRERPKAPNREAIPPALLEQGRAISVAVGQVRSFMLLDEPVRRMYLVGSSASAFWTVPYLIDRMEEGRLAEHKGADLHLVGATPGTSRLVLELQDGRATEIRIDVHPPRHTSS